MPHVKKWLFDYGDDWLRHLTERYAISAVEDDGLVSLKYNQIESPMHEPIVQECRGMVVDLASRRVVCHPYNKFWNLGETLAAPIDWSTARVQDKLDGSLMLLYWHEGQWMVASSGSPRAGGSYGKESWTYAQQFWSVFKETGMVLPHVADQEIGFFFELCAPDNRIVVKYEEPRLILHGARNVTTEHEMPRAWLEDVADSYGWPVVKEHPLRTPDEVDEAVRALDPVRGEGFIVVDGSHNRVKIKSPRYVALHKLRDRTTVGAIITLWKEGEVEELLTYFPEYEKDVLGVVGKLEQACEDAYSAYSENLGRAQISRKAYAEAVKGKVWTSIAFKLLYNNADSVEDARKILRAGFDTLAEKIVEAYT